MITMLPVTMMAVYMYPSDIIDGEAPMSRSSSRAYKSPGMPITRLSATPTAIDWVAAIAAPSLFFSPILLETMAVVAILKPIPMAYTNVINDSVRPTVATASAPSLETKKMSTTAKMASIIISSTMGMDKRKMPRPRCPSVKSCSVPLIASFMSRRRPLRGKKRPLVPELSGSLR